MDTNPVDAFPMDAILSEIMFKRYIWYNEKYQNLSASPPPHTTHAPLGSPVVPLV